MEVEKRRRERKKRRYLGRWLAVGVVGLIVVALLTAIGWYFLRVNPSLEQTEPIATAFPDETLRPSEDPAAGDSVNVLLLGSDSRASDGSLLTDLGDRADAIMVAHIPPDRGTVQVMSIMRDSWVDIPGRGMSKVNSALADGGVPLMVQTVESIIDQRIDHVAVIDFDGFENLTTALGGVTLQNDLAFSDRNYDFPAGEITVEGEEALAYVRARYPFADGDYQRVYNQRAFLRGLVSQLMTRENLTNPDRAANLFASIAPYVATSETFSPTTVLGLAPALAGLDASQIRTFTMPTSGTGSEAGQSVVYVNWDAVEDIRAAFKEESMNDFEPAPER